jgi:hypothetical protein
MIRRRTTHALHCSIIHIRNYPLLPPLPHVLYCKNNRRSLRVLSILSLHMGFLPFQIRRFDDRHITIIVRALFCAFLSPFPWPVPILLRPLTASFGIVYPATRSRPAKKVHMDNLVPTPRHGGMCATNPCKSSPALVVT